MYMVREDLLDECDSVDAMTPRIEKPNSEAVTFEGSMNQNSLDNFSNNRRPSADLRLKALQERLIQLEELNDRLKLLRSERSASKKFSASDSDDFGFPQTRESASIQDQDGGRMLGSPYNVESAAVTREIDKNRPMVARIDFKNSGSYGQKRIRDQEENSNPKSTFEELASRKSSLVNFALDNDSSQHVPQQDQSTLTTLQKSAPWDSLLRQSTQKLNVFSRTAARKTIHEHCVMVESRAAHAAPVQSAQQTEQCEPRSLDEAMERTVPYLFGGYTRKSPVRMVCFKMHRSPLWGAFFMLVNMASCIFITTIPEVPLPRPSIFIDDFNQFQSPVDRADVPTAAHAGGINIFDLIEYLTFTAMATEVVVGCIAVGFVSQRTAWLRNSYFHKIDFVVLMLTVIDYTLHSVLYLNLGLPKGPFRVFRLFRLLRPVIKMKAFSDMKQMLETLSRGIGQLSMVMVTLMLFLLAFSLFGMAILKGSFRRRCVTLDHYVPAPAGVANIETGVMNWTADLQTFRGQMEYVLVPGGDVVVSGGYPFETACKIYKNTSAGQFDGKYPLSNGVYHSCGWGEFVANESIYQTCASVGNPMYGFQHFDHLGGSLLVLIQYTVPDSAYDPLHTALESEPVARPFTWIYFLLISLFNTYIMLGLVLAVITGTFKEAASSSTSRVHPEPQPESSSTTNRIVLSENGKQKSSSLDAGFEQFELSTVPKAAALSQGQSNGPGEIKNDAFDMSETLPKKEESREDPENGEDIMRHWAQNTLSDHRVIHGVSLTIVGHVFTMNFDDPTSSGNVPQIITGVYIYAHVIYIAELALKYIADGMSFSSFVKSRSNVAESTLVMCGIVGILARSRVLLMIPSIRLFRLVEYVSTMYALLQNLVATSRIFMQLLFFTTITCTAFAVLGRYIFRNSMDECTRSNYGTFFRAMLTTFQVFTGDSWSGVLYCSAAALNGQGSQVLTTGFIIIILYDLFVVIIIAYFKVSDTIDMIQRPGKIMALRRQLRDLYKRFFELLSVAGGTNKTVVPSSLGGKLPKSFIGVKLQGLRAKFSSTHAIRSASISDPQSDPVSAGVANKCCKELLTAAMAQMKPGLLSAAGSEEDEEDDDDEDNNALMFFNKRSLIRISCRWLKGNPIFVVTIYATVVSSCLLVMSTPQAPDIPGQKMLIPLAVRDACDLIFTCIFTIEMVVNVIAQGFILHKSAYLRNGWNILDFIILFLSWLELSKLFPGSQGKVFRLARAIRPLRLIKRNKGLRVLSEALFCTLRPVSYVTGFGCVTTIVFAIIGKGMFGGLMHLCNFGAEFPQGKLQCSGLHVDQENGILLPRAWFTPQYNFDSFYQSTLTLVRVLTLKYVDILRAAMDVTYRDVSPQNEFSRLNSLFFVAYIVIGPVVIMNLFVAFICDGFNLYRESSELDVYYSKFVRQIEHTSPHKLWFKVPTNSFNSTDSFNQMMDQQNFFFFIELCFEVLLNLIGHGPGGFVDDHWKGFDLLVMCGTTIGYLSTTKEFLIFSKAFRLFRVIRLMRMVKVQEIKCFWLQKYNLKLSYPQPIRIILETLVSILPAVGNILLLLCLFYSMFATLFVQVFGVTKYGNRISETANFESFPAAMYTIYQMVIGDEWMTIMDDVSIQWPVCTERFNSDYLYNYTGTQYSFGDCGSSYSRFYFVIFKLICECILLNLFVGVVLENFGFITDEISDREDPGWRSGPSNRQVKELTAIFEKYSAFTGQVAIQSAVTSMLFHLPVPIGFHVEEYKWEYDEHERAAQRMIRAELNVILLQHNMRAEQQQLEWGWLWGIPGISHISKQTARMASRRFINGVRFQDVAMVLVFWRKPSLIPEAVKAQRRVRIEDVAMMYCALLITDFFKRLVAKRKSSALKKSMQSKFVMKRWMTGEDPCRRRTEFYAEILQEEIAFAAACRKTVARVRCPVSMTHTLIAVPKEGMPASAPLCLHHEAVRLKVRNCRHIHGIDMFRSRVSKHPVLVHFVDAVNLGSPDFYLDLRPIQWNGWQLTESELDSFWRPVRLSSSVRKNPVQWDAFEFTSPGGGSDGPPKEWTLLDVQSFVNYNNGEPSSFVRLNLGAKDNVNELMDSEQREMLLGAVVEVLGYAEVDTATGLELDGQDRSQPENRKPDRRGPSIERSRKNSTK